MLMQCVSEHQEKWIGLIRLPKEHILHRHLGVALGR